MQILGWGLFFIVAAFVGFSLYVRLAPVDRENYSAPPDKVQSDGKPHEYALLGEDAPCSPGGSTAGTSSS